MRSRNSATYRHFQILIFVHGTHSAASARRLSSPPIATRIATHRHASRWRSLASSAAPWIGGAATTTARAAGRRACSATIGPSCTWVLQVWAMHATRWSLAQLPTFSSKSELIGGRNRKFFFGRGTYKRDVSPRAPLIATHRQKSHPYKRLVHPQPRGSQTPTRTRRLPWVRAEM